MSWQPDTLQLMMPGSIEEGLRTGEPQFFPKLQGIMALLSRRVTGASRHQAMEHRTPPAPRPMQHPTRPARMYPDVLSVPAIRRVSAAASAWVHLLTINLFAALHCYTEGAHCIAHQAHHGSAWRRKWKRVGLSFWSAAADRAQPDALTPLRRCPFPPPHAQPHPRLTRRPITAQTSPPPGLRYQIPYHHSLLVSMVAGPLGLVSHFFTRATVASRRLRLQPMERVEVPVAVPGEGEASPAAPAAR